MTTRDRFITSVDEFDAFVLRDENIKRNFEYIAGKVIEREAALDIEGMIGAEIIGHLFMHIEEVDSGWLFGAMCGYQIGTERYIPNTSYLSYERYPKLTGVYYNPNPPDLAVEMMSVHRPRELELLPVKLQNYLAAGTVVWVMRADQARIEVHEPDKKAVVLHRVDTLTGGEILPGFELEVATLFEELPE